MRMLGIDIGGTGIKGAPVDLDKGTLTADRMRVKTPASATPEAVIGCIEEIIRHFEWKSGLGCTFPGVVRQGEVLSSAHLDKAWLDLQAETLMAEKLHVPVRVINDADAAALAEVKFGAGRGVEGLVLMVTLGTGIGTGLVYRGVLIPNAELGHIELNGKDAELRASNTAREKKKMSWKKYAHHVSDYLIHLERLLCPDLIILGGGMVHDADRILPRLKARTQVVPATLGNEAGIVGASLAAAASVKAGSNGARRGARS